MKRFVDAATVRKKNFAARYRESEVDVYFQLEPKLPSDKVSRVGGNAGQLEK